MSIVEGRNDNCATMKKELILESTLTEYMQPLPDLEFTI
jgi:hypothetical protein